ncbi:MAG: hypothetical protein FD130_1070 [Halothiobacillaceae bacterium]|nr:MAG: hypothetical protein FD130_1070 [Halothiobacillaceae bacterium]
MTTFSPPPTTTHQIGSDAESVARYFLEQQGLTLVSANYRTKVGEIDLIMREGAHLVFVEVRYRRSSAYGGAIATITASKQRKLTATAQYYLQTHYQNRPPPCRFDITPSEIPVPLSGGKPRY